MLHSRDKAGGSDTGTSLAKALLRATERLKFKATTLSAVIGVSEATISRMKKGEYALEDGTKPFELAVLLIRLYRSLDAIVGGEDRIARAWLENPNSVFDARPIEKIGTVAGLVDVIAYLDARRALV